MILDGHESENSNFSWMRTVTKEEDERSLKRWNEWAMKPVEERMPKGNGAGEWLYEKESSEVESKLQRRFQYVGPYNSYAEHIAAVEEMNRIEHEKQFGLKDSLTPGAKQLDWETPTEFPQTPQIISDTPLLDYLSRLSKGTIYCRNQYSDSPVYDAAMSENQSHIAVLTRCRVLPIMPYRKSHTKTVISFIKVSAHSSQKTERTNTSTFLSTKSGT